MKLDFQNILDADEELVELVRNWRNNKKISKYMFTNHYITKEEHNKWLEKLKKQNTAKTWIIKYNKKPIGVVSLFDINYKNKSTDWGFYIADESIREKGLGSATLFKLMKYVFEEMNFNEMHTKVLENNIVAMRMYKKIGFKKDGKLDRKLVREGKHVDIILMKIKKRDWRNIKNSQRYYRKSSSNIRF